MSPINLNNIKQLFSGSYTTIVIDVNDQAYHIFQIDDIAHIQGYRVKTATNSTSTDSDHRWYVHFAMIATKIQS